MACTFVRSGVTIQRQPADVATALRDALAADGVVDVVDELSGSPELAFTLATHARGPAVIAATPDGHCLAVCVDPLVAAVYAFHAIDRAAQHRRPARPDRARRRVAREAAGP